MRTGLATITALALTLTGCGAKTGTTPPAISVSAPPAGQATTDQAPSAPGVTSIGQWAKTEGGVEFRVSKLARATIPEYAAGGRVGNPAVVVTVEVKNGSNQRLDLSLMNVSVRLGQGGREAESVYTDSYGSPTGTLAPGRTSTHKRMFAAETKAELGVVSVEVSPGFDYNSAIFEGAA